MHCNYKIDENVLKDIIKHNVNNTNNQEEIARCHCLLQKFENEGTFHEK